jgi:hypothetical protein
MSIQPSPKKKRDSREELYNYFIKLGWRKIILHKITEIGNHSNLEYYKLYATHWFNDSNTESFQKRLYEIGFTKSNSHLFYNLVKPLTSYSEAQLFDLILEYGLGKLKAIRPDSNFLFDIKEDEWITVKNNYIFNMSSSFEDIPTMIKTLPTHEEDNIVCYHTTNWRSFDTFRNFGILPSKNRSCLDFGITGSFYVTPDYYTCQEYAENKAAIFSNETCVLVFSIPRKQLDNFNLKIFKTNTKDWTKLTKSSRICEDDANELDNFDIIYGPMVANPIKVANKLEEPIPHKKHKFQYAFKKESACNFLNKCWGGTIFFDKSYFYNKI